MTMVVPGIFRPMRLAHVIAGAFVGALYALATELMRTAAIASAPMPIANRLILFSTAGSS
jgi:hypothetical protein